MREGEYHNFCLDHVREYNKSYNYFAGMADDDVAAYQRSAATGHRPTWAMGVEGGAGQCACRRARLVGGLLRPVRHLRRIVARRLRRIQRPSRRDGRSRTSSRSSFRVLDLDGSETGAEIKARYKSLVKLLHPDANGGDRSSEDRLRQIIQAYHYLRSVGFC